MIKIRKSAERGHADHGWLKSKHTFSFADYYDPKNMGFSLLRVLNEDWIAGGTGFPTHGHQNMEIISYVVEGALQHKDSMGNETIILPNEVQRMTAGTGVRHSEYNHLPHSPTHLLQIWILPEKNGMTPSYDQKMFQNQIATGDLVLVGSQTGREGSLLINQDVEMHVCKSQKAGEKVFQTKSARNIWIQVIRGTVAVENETLFEGDGAGIQKLETIHLKWQGQSEFIVFDLP